MDLNFGLTSTKTRDRLLTYLDTGLNAGISEHKHWQVPVQACTERSFPLVDRVPQKEGSSANLLNWQSLTDMNIFCNIIFIMKKFPTVSQ